jgi:hypothetical protein
MCEREKRQEQRVESGDCRHAGDAGIAKGLRDAHRRQFDSGQGIADTRAGLNGRIPRNRIGHLRLPGFD